MNGMFGGGGIGKVGNKLVDRFFRRVDDVVWDLMSGKIGIKRPDGIATLSGTGKDAEVCLNLFDDFGVALPAFAQNTPMVSINFGDLIYGAKGPMGWVVEKKPKTCVLLRPDGSRLQWSPPKVQSMGFDASGAMVLRSLINTLPEGGLGGLQSMLLPMMMMGGDMGDTMNDILPALLLSQTQGGAAGAGGAANPMGGMLQMMLMMKMMGGNKGGATGPNTGKAGNFFDRG
jgi:hypothetical protein